ncbi:expressed unknown protein [Seminavis robusta]|uniref:Uncharacterized protein n=1 Tax=Seminavis robusta TaxID=568900 RepID=A0A9N8HKW3_9STRA|nr:expressed unknown protein [Seminavis robusta]|eukprot:Sro641_g180020.1 n/a (207) ;mRNA; f:27186-27806
MTSATAALNQYFRDLFAAAPASVEKIVVVPDNVGAMPEELSHSARVSLLSHSSHHLQGSCRWESAPANSCTSGSPDYRRRLVQDDDGDSVDDSDLDYGYSSSSTNSDSDEDSSDDSTPRLAHPPVVCTNSAPRRPQRRNSLPPKEDKIVTTTSLKQQLRYVDDMWGPSTASGSARQSRSKTPSPPKHLPGSPPDRPKRTCSPPPAA